MTVACGWARTYTSCVKPAELPPCPPHCAQCSLRKAGAFLPVTEAELDFIKHFRSDTLRLGAGKEIIREQSNGHKLFTLFSGWAFRFKTLTDGRRQILNFLLPGDFIGLQQEFAEGATYGVESITAVALCAFPSDRLWDLYREHPNLGYDVTWLSARDEQMLDENLLTNGRRNAMERVATLLIHLFKRAQRVGLVIDEAIDFPLNQQHIADALGLSLVHTNRTLRRLQQLGLHEIDNGKLRLRNVKALQRLADYAEHPLRRVPLL